MNALMSMVCADFLMLQFFLELSTSSCTLRLIAYFLLSLKVLTEATPSLSAAFCHQNKDAP